MDLERSRRQTELNYPALTFVRQEFTTLVSTPVCIMQDLAVFIPKTYIISTFSFYMSQFD